MKERTGRLIHKLAIIGLGVSCLLLADDETRQKVQLSKSERVDFQVGGVLRLTNSVGDLTVEGWDRADAEITTITSTKADYPNGEREKVSQELQKVRVTTEHHGDELVITTDYPRHLHLPPPLPWSDATSFDLEYRIHVPRNTRIVIEHGTGEVYLDNLTGDIHANVLQGDIMLHLPEKERYDINAKTDVGSVNSDYPGVEKRRPWLVGHRIVNQNAPGAHTLHLRVGFGDILILKTRVPKPPGPIAAASKTDGL
jgi:hypothetical protein